MNNDEREIMSISNGWGQGSDYFKVGEKIGDYRITHIKKEWDHVEQNRVLVSYNIYSDSLLLAKIHTGYNVTIWFDNKKK